MPSGQVEGASRERGATPAAPAPRWLLSLGRFGYAALGVLWFLLGWLALQLALGSSSPEASQQGAFRELASTTAGRALLLVIVVGLVMYALWQLVEAVWGYRFRPRGERAAQRVGAVGRAVFALTLSVTAVRVLLRAGGGSEEQVAADVLTVPGGVVLVAGTGIVTVGLGAWFVYRGWTGTFAGNLDAGVDRRVIAAGRVGHVARGVSVCVLGGLVLAAAVRHDPSEAGGTDAAFGALLALPLGAVLTGAVAVGLMCFGIFQVATARHTHER